MITGFAKKICLYCGNHSEPIKMYVKQTETDAFYACPRYYPDNRGEEDKPCMNRISIYEYEKMMNKLMDYIQDEEENGGTVYLKNYKFQTNMAKYKVIEESKEETKIAVVSKSIDTVRQV